MKKSLHTRVKKEAVMKVAEYLVKSITIQHAGAEVIITGDNTAHEMAIAQGIIQTTYTSKRLSDVLEIFLEEKTTDGSWTEKTAFENRSIIQTFVNHAGGINTGQIGHDTLNTYKQHILKTDKSPRTLNKYISRVGSFCAWMERHGYIEKNYSKGLGIRVKNNAYEDRERFTLEEVGILIANTGNKKPFHYWLPRLAFYTGARLGELCQLHCSDVNDGSINVNDDGDKRLKNRSSKRIIPIHSALVGFEDFCDRGGRVFEELSLTRNGYGEAASRWFKRYRDSLDIGKTFHSFRHTFTDELKQAMVMPSVIDELTGHSIPGESMNRYGKRYRVTVLKDAVETIPASSAH